MNTHLSRRTFLLATPAALLLGRSAAAGLFSRTVPGDLDLSLTRTSDGGRFRAELQTGARPVIGRMQTWTVLVLTARGVPVTEASIDIDGGMPQHGHGLPTAPRVTRNLADGRYLIEGVKFNMHGWWTFVLCVNTPDGTDSVTFNLML